MHTYSIYDQRFNRMIQSTLKTLAEIQAKRKRETAVHFRIACILYTYNKENQIAWDPADDGFVFSSALLDRKMNLLCRFGNANKGCNDHATDDEIDAFMAKDIM